MPPPPSAGIMRGLHIYKHPLQGHSVLGPLRGHSVIGPPAGTLGEVQNVQSQGLSCVLVFKCKMCNPPCNPCGKGLGTLIFHNSIHVVCSAGNRHRELFFPDLWQQFFFWTRVPVQTGVNWSIFWTGIPVPVAAFFRDRYRFGPVGLTGPDHRAAKSV